MLPLVVLKFSLKLSEIRMLNSKDLSKNIRESLKLDR